MTREQVIEVIEHIFPADSKYEETADIGTKLLFQAIADQWRQLPTAVLARYAEFCIEHEKRCIEDQKRRLK